MDIAVCCSYFRESLAELLVDELRRTGAALHLWSLDTPMPSLAAWTRGGGLLPKFHALNHLLPHCKDADLVFFIDDDVRLPSDFLESYLTILDRLGAAISQPALTANSHHSYPITLERKGCWARLTNFVESGPVVAMTRPFLDKVTPFPDTTPMGWGLEAHWSGVARSLGARMAIVDACAVDHSYRPIGSRYSTAEAWNDMQRLICAQGYPWPTPRELKRYYRIYQHAAEWFDAYPTPAAVTAGMCFSIPERELRLLWSVIALVHPATILHLGPPDSALSSVIAQACEPWKGKVIQIHPEVAPMMNAPCPHYRGIQRDIHELYPCWTLPCDVIFVDRDDPKEVERILNTWIQAWLGKEGVALFRHIGDSGSRTAATIRAWLREQPATWLWQEFPDDCGIGLLWRSGDRVLENSSMCYASYAADTSTTVRNSGQSGRRLSPPQHRTTQVSLVIAGHNEGDCLWKTVRSSSESFGDHDYEIVIADDASTDSSVTEVCRRFPWVRIVGHAERRGCSPTKDLGARGARGDILIFLDGHCKPEPGALPRLVADVEELSGNAVVVPQVLVLDTNCWENDRSRVGCGARVSLDTLRPSWIGLDKMHPYGPFWESPALIGCCLAMTRDVYHRLWGFDPGMHLWGTEDTDFGLKAWLMGVPILHDPEAIIGHRFQMRFGRYSVAEEYDLANQFRLARKNFSNEVWEEWLERRRPHYSEGLWSLAWQLFSAERDGVERERDYLLARRVHDELWYSSRFGLMWPRPPRERQTWQLGADGFLKDPRDLFRRHAEHPSNCQALVDAHLTSSASIGMGTELTIYLKLMRNPSGRILVSQAAFRSEGCLLVRAYGSLLTEMIHGKALDFLYSLQPEDLCQLLDIDEDWLGSHPWNDIEKPHGAPSQSRALPFEAASLAIKALRTALLKL